MDVFDRPLFQNRAARDRLKDMGNVRGFRLAATLPPDREIPTSQAALARL